MTLNNSPHKIQHSINDKKATKKLGSGKILFTFAPQSTQMIAM
jgi:hypothetical protein